MRSINILLVTAAALMSSCSVYRSGQTPDDVYFSPTREQDAYVQVNNSPDRYGSSYNESMPSEDNYLRMRVMNPGRWSAFDNYNYYNDWSYAPYSPYNSGFSLGYGNINPYYGYSYNNYYNSYMNWNNYYNPYYPSVVIVNPKTNPAGYTTMRNFNAGSYRNTNYNSAVNRSRLYAPSNNVHNNAPGNNNGTLGNSMRRIFSGSNSARSSGNTYTNPNSSDRPVRSYTPSSNNNNNNYSSGSTRSNSSGSSGSSSGSSSSGSRPSRR
ncbi:MAG: hypothetical protein ABI687_01040 [Flavitalea sp.]